MTVYVGDDPDHFAAALASVLRQSPPADQVVLVEDGPLSPEVRDHIDHTRARNPTLEVVALPENQGLVTSLNTGLGHCRGEYVFRMDADDICMPGRFGAQLAYMEANADVGVLGAAMAEFSEDPRKPDSVKRMPMTHDAIMRVLPFRNPLNHPTVCMRRTVIPESGYPDLRYVEDYFLWARLAAAGVRFHNLDEVLLAYRFNAHTLGRRSGWSNFRNEMTLRLWMRRHGLLSWPVFMAAGLVQVIVRFSPPVVQRVLWRLTRAGPAEL